MKVILLLLFELTLICLLAGISIAAFGIPVFEALAVGFLITVVVSLISFVIVQ